MNKAGLIIARVRLGDTERQFDLSAGRCIGLPLDPAGPQPRFFGAPPMRAEALAVGGFTGRVKTGASCNVDVVTLVPHCNGTHTEGPGHIADSPLPVQTALPPGPLPARLITVTPEISSGEHYPVALTPEEGLIVSSAVTADCPVLVIRTLPNGEDKRRRDYGARPYYPLLSAEAMHAIVTAGVRHLLIDTPSVDRADDGGRLANHRVFWGMNETGTEPAPNRGRCTITELIFVPNDVSDGLYLLDLGVSSIVGDASPSAPVLYPEI